MALIKQLSFVTASVPALSSLNIDDQVFPRAALICKVKVTQEAGKVGGTSQLFLYENNARTQLFYKTSDTSQNPFYDPVQDEGGVISEVRRGAIGVYEQTDGALIPRLTIENGDSQAKTFTIAIDYINLTTAGAVTFGELTTGAVNGANKAFTLAAAADANYPVFLKVKSTLLEESASAYQFTRSGQVCTLGASVTAPAVGDPQPRAFYVKA